MTHPKIKTRPFHGSINMDIFKETKTDGWTHFPLHWFCGRNYFHFPGITKIIPLKQKGRWKNSFDS